MKRRVCALLMCCALVVAMVPSSVLAAGDTSDESEEKATQEVAQESEETSGASFQSEDGTIMITPSNGEDEDEKADDTENVSDEAEDETGEVTEEESEEDDEEDEDVTYTAKNENIRVEVTAPSGALPEGAKLHVKRYDEDSSEYRDAAKAIGIDPDTEEDTGMAALDISFLLDGNEVEPTEPVKVSIDASAILPADADAASMEVQHLVENGNEVTPVIVANTSSNTEGTIDKDKATAEFEVASFSSFTITWAGDAAGGNSTEITVYLYDTNGLGIYDSDEQATYTWAVGEHTIADLVEEHVAGKIGDGYTYAYATVGYLTTSAMGGNVTTVGSSDDPVVSVSWNGTSYTITTSNGSTTVASSDADEFYINLYFSTPSVTISVTGADTTNHTVSLTADTKDFQDSEISYSWEITSGGEYASITGNGANATVTWNEGDEAGTDITVKVTATSSTGETATATYDLEYGMQQVTYTVYYNGSTLASGAHVAVYDESGNLVSNGEADENGQVTLWIVPGTTYTLEASYTASSGTGQAATYTHYSYEDTSYVYADGDETDIYLTTSDANFYEHIDVKLSIAEEDAGYSDILANVDYIKIYDEAGELVYQSSQMVHNEGTNDYNVLFADADGNEGTNPHSIAFYDTYTIEIAYEVSYTYTDDQGNTQEYTESYVARIDKDSTYMDGEYYSYNGTNAYQLYNTIYGTTYDADSFATAVANGTLEDYNEHGISLDGLTYFYVAAALCDTKDTTNQAGLDLALGVNSLRRYSSTTWNFDVQKTLKNSGADAGAFSFSLYDATVDDESIWSVNVSDGYEFTLSNGTMTMADGSTESVDNMSGFFAFDYDSTMVGKTQTYYFVLVEDPGDDENITYSNAVYGIKVEVTLNSSTDMTNVTITETAYTLTESESSDEAYRTFTQGDEFDGSADDDGFTIFPFENTYKASGSVSFGVTKTISGRNTTAKSFTFALYSADEDFNYSAETLIKDQSTTGTLTENEAQSVIFDTDIEYTEGGTYYYVIKETTNSGNGWTCDGTEYHIIVTAANDGSGNIVPTEVTYTYVDSEGTTQSGTLTADEDGVYGISGDSTLSFTNSYKDADGDVKFGGTKSITGTTDTDAIFAFGLYEANEDFEIDESKEVHATTVTGAGNFTFEDIIYEEAGTYYYVVKETTENGSGWTVDGTEYYITVIVTDEGDEGEGNFTIAVSCVSSNGNEVTLTSSESDDGVYTITGLDFENEYDASGSLNLTATKEYTGAALTANQFNFTITETTDGATYTGTGTNDANGNITFTPAIEYSLSDVGTHTYEIAETAGDADGVTYDSNKITVTVKVADAGDGTLSTTVTVGEDEIEATDGSYNVGTFNNTYEATGGVTLTATKTYTGATMTAGQFEFQIAETSGEYLGTGTNDADGNITFSPEITYTLDDVGTHTYRIVEVNGYAGGVTYDDSEIIVTVVVADNGDGTLSTTVTVNGEALTVGDDGAYNVGTFDNSYEATGSVTFGGEKTIEGIENTNQTFEFALYTTDSDFAVAEDAEATDTQTVTGAGSFTFGAISYDSDDEEGNGAGTYYYVVKETATNTNGWTSDTKEYRITVVVEDAGNGTFALTVTCEDAEGQTVALEGTDANGEYNFTGLDFTNEYEPAPTSVQFTGSKYITNSTGTDKVFTFELYSADDTFATSEDAIQTKTTTGADTITFDAISYDETGTYYYVIKEQALDKAEGWTIDSTVYNITVEVTDDGAGQLVATVTVDGTEVSGTEDVYGGFDFTNAYAAEGNVTLGVVKSISGVSSTDEEFEFTLYGSDENFATSDSIETITTEGTITNSTQLNFSAISYTEAGTYYYVIKETGTAPDGWTLDSTEYHVTVTVTDNGDGTLTTSVSYAYVDENEETQTENSAAFTNTYAASGSLSLSGTKTFTGGTLAENGFSFTMMDSTGASVGDVTMDADGTITFPTLSYNEKDIGGEYTYTITEVAGTDSSVQYDDTTYTVVVSVADNGDGTLDVTYTVNGTESGDITFTNYQKGSLTITKTFTGLSDEQIENLTGFTLTVTNSDGDTVATLTLDDTDDDSSYTWTVSDLPADTYTVTESGYSLDGYEVIAKSGTVEVTDGSDVSVNDELAWGGEDTVEFTNDYIEVGTITVTKYVTAESDIKEAHEDTEYTVVITSSEDADFQWVTVTSSLGREITPTIDGNTITFTITESETVTISGLPAGEYTVEEQGSDAMTSEHCVPSYRVGDEETEEAPTVAVASGEKNVVAIEIDNEYPIGTYIQVQKNYNKDYPTGDDAFTFTIEALSADLDAGGTLDASEMPMPKNSTVTITGNTVGYIGLITFDDEENEFEHFGTYYYKITETKGSLDNVDYDESVHYVKIVVAFDNGSHVLTTVEYEAKADAETDDYKDLDYEEAGIVTAEFTNTAYDELTLEKEVSGNAGDTSEYEFEITLTKDGTGYTGDIETTDDEETENPLAKVVEWFSGIVKMLAGDSTDTITFTDGKGTVTIKAGESVTLLIPSGWNVTVTEKTTGADTTTVYRDGEVIVQAKGTTSEATAELGTIADSTQVKFVNSYRSYFPIDEEIVTDTDDIFDRDAWVKDEAVNEYNAIEIEMTTNLPVVTAYDLENGEFTMNFHNELDHELVLDENTADFSVYIGETEISSAYYRITFDDDTGDDCNFHVDVDLTALYKDGIVTEDMLDGNTEITIFFFADLEGTDLNGSYISTIWYDIYDGDELLYTSNKSVVAVYTYEIEIIKYDVSDESEKLSDATFGVYYDEDCTEPVSRNGEDYTAVSDKDGVVMFYGLADGTYYVKELKAPAGYVLSDEVIKVELGEDLNDSDYTYHTTFANTPEQPGSDGEPSKAVDTDGDGNFNDDGEKVNVGDKLTYAITYYNNHDEAETVVITDTLDYALDFVSATDGGTYDADTRTITWTIKDAEPGWGYVYFTATVNDIALIEEEIENTATVKVGDDEAKDTNMVANPTPDSSEAGVPGSGTPKTGDDNHLFAWTLLLLASLLAMGTAYAIKKQSKRRVRNKK